MQLRVVIDLRGVHLIQIRLLALLHLDAVGVQLVERLNLCAHGVIEVIDRLRVGHAGLLDNRLLPAQILHVRLELLKHALRELMHVDDVLGHGIDGLRCGAQILLRVLVLRAHLFERLAELEEFAVERLIHALHKARGDAVDSFDLLARGCDDEIIHRALHRQHRPQDGLLHLRGHAPGDFLDHLAHVLVLLLLHGDDLRAVVHGPFHGVMLEGIDELAQRALAFAGSGAVEQVEDQRSDHAEDRG